MPIDSINTHQPLCIAIQPIFQHSKNLNFLSEPEALEETSSLIKARGWRLCDLKSQKIRAYRPGWLFGKGMLDTLKQMIQEHNAAFLFINADIDSITLRNLQKFLSIGVIDRSSLILDIFASRSKTPEGKLQIQKARLSFEKSRLVKAWSHLERQRGGMGFLGGPGETQMEADRRMIEAKITRLDEQLLLEKQRRYERSKQRHKQHHSPLVALIGYTNVGKSSLFRLLSANDAEVDDMVFATLDVNTKRTQKKIRGFSIDTPWIVHDTVGFIQNLHHHLIDSFRSSMDAMLDASIILHVIDMSDPSHFNKINIVEKFIHDTFDQAIPKKSMPPIIKVWNKVDQIDMTAVSSDLLSISCKTGDGIENLIIKVQDALRASQAVSMYNVEFLVERWDIHQWLMENIHGVPIRIIKGPDTNPLHLQIQTQLDQRLLKKIHERFGLEVKVSRI